MIEDCSEKIEISIAERTVSMMDWQWDSINPKAHSNGHIYIFSCKFALVSSIF